MVKICAYHIILIIGIEVRKKHMQNMCDILDAKKTNSQSTSIIRSAHLVRVCGVKINLEQQQHYQNRLAFKAILATF